LAQQHEEPLRLHSFGKVITENIERHSVIHACILKACISSKYSKCTSAIKRILYTIAMYISSSSFVYLFFFHFTTMHVESLALCVWEWRRYTIQL